MACNRISKRQTSASQVQHPHAHIATSSCWQAVTPSSLSRQVIEERFGPTVVPVPFLEDAASYDLLTVLIKKPQLGPSLLRRPRCLVPVGPLENLLHGATAARELTHCTREYNARVRGESRYEETRLVEGALRHIRLTLAGVHKKVAFLVLRPGAVALRPDLPWLRSQSSLYIIYEVFYCGSLRLAVAQGNEHRALALQHALPIAFSCLKFALSSKGVLGAQKPMGHTLPTKAAWVRMAMLESPAPPAPLLLPPPKEAPGGGRKRWRALGRPSRSLAGETGGGGHGTQCCWRVGGQGSHGKEPPPFAGCRISSSRLGGSQGRPEGGYTPEPSHFLWPK